MDQDYPKSFAVAGKIKPFLQSFDLDIDENDGHLVFRDSNTPNATWIRTIVNIPDIIRFYNYISSIEQQNKVPKEALNLDYTGKALGWKFRDYSDLKELHPANYSGKDLNRWIAHVKRKFPQG
jgi:hypothetical protein